MAACAFENDIVHFSFWAEPTGLLQKRAALRAVNERRRSCALPWLLLGFWRLQVPEVGKNLNSDFLNPLQVIAVLKGRGHLLLVGCMQTPALRNNMELFSVDG
jgi:hypothetical protein